MAIKVTADNIIDFNKRYYICHNYSQVARETGFSASTVRKYIDKNWDFLQVLRKKFADCGYELPKLIMWNVEARHDTFLTNNENVLFVSGQSASTFKQLCANLNGKTAWDLMIETLNDKMYDCVRV